VIIDFESPTAEQWTGSIQDGSGQGPSVRFDGRLHLLRLLEALIEHTEPDTEGSP
jgi:hypothetical protein